MPQEDYFKREIDKLGKILAKALSGLNGLKLEGRLPEGIEEINSVFQTELGIDLLALISLPEKEFLSFLLIEKKLNNLQLELIADLLFESVSDQDPDTASKCSKALVLYKAVTENESDYSINRRFKIEAIRQLSGLI
jgi:hypothetical protein